MVFYSQEKHWTYEKVENDNPSAYLVLKVEGGWISFDSSSEYEMFMQQK